MFQRGDIVKVKATTQLVRSRIAGLAENRWVIVSDTNARGAADPKRDIRDTDMLWMVESLCPAAHLQGDTDSRWVAERNLILLEATP